MYLKRVKLLAIYAKDFLLFAFLMSGITYYIYVQLEIHLIGNLIWFKLISSGIGLYYHQNRKQGELFFYLNHGLGKLALILVALLTDFSTWLIGLILLIQYAS
ncbi:MAG: hypothetical protein AAF696_00705 [Bacteroidota bacterium]